VSRVNSKDCTSTNPDVICSRDAPSSLLLARALRQSSAASERFPKQSRMASSSSLELLIIAVSSGLASGPGVHE
jgi:hypothetical protein